MEHISHELRKWLPLLVDPETKGALTYEPGKLVGSDGKVYAFVGHRPDFVGVAQRAEFAEERDFLDRVKTGFKNYLGKYYMLLVYVISPVYVRIHWPSLTTFLTHKVAEVCQGREFVVQLGSGNSRILPGILNVDIFDYQEVDLVADCLKLPFADNSLDCVISVAVIEHIQDPDAFLAEAFRVLKPGGKIITGAPFIQGFHASPNDYFRWTHRGLEIVHARKGFVLQELAPMCGPTSGFLWVAQEWLSIALSLNSNFLYKMWWCIFTILLMPLKFLDVFLASNENSSKINSFYLYIGSKGMSV